MENSTSPLPSDSVAPAPSALRGPLPRANSFRPFPSGSSPLRRKREAAPLRGLEQIFRARFAERVSDRPGCVLALAVLADLGVDHGQAVLALEFVAFVLGAHAVGDANQAAALLEGVGARQAQE